MIHEELTRFQTDEEKALAISEILLDQFYNRQGYFENYQMPEYILPSNIEHGSKEHALWLTYVISIDKLTNAVKLWKNAREEHIVYPEHFNPENILSFSEGKLSTITKRVGARFPQSGAATWKKISQILKEEYEGDPRSITPEPVSIQEMKERMDKFPQLRGPKLFNFYLRAMGETNLFSISDFDELDIAVDKQVARLTLYTGVLQLLSKQFTGCVHEQPLRRLIEQAWRTPAKKLGSPPWKLDEPLWTIGSQLCSKRKCTQCPIKHLCNKTKGITFKEAVVTWKTK